MLCAFLNCPRKDKKGLKKRGGEKGRKKGRKREEKKGRGPFFS